MCRFLRIDTKKRESFARIKFSKIECQMPLKLKIKCQIPLKLKIQLNLMKCVFSPNKLVDRVTFNITISSGNYNKQCRLQFVVRNNNVIEGKLVT
jgi:hypothetical protein